MEIYKFNNILKPVLWGGDKLVAFKGLPACDEPIGESWELSAVPGHESVVKGGEDDGLTLSQLVQRYGADLVGEDVYRRYGDCFPLLIKLIDAKRDLSIQVHPDDAMAQRRHGSFGKNEMWYILDADEGATIATGFKRPITPEEFDRHLAEGTILDVVNRDASHPGDVFYIPAGMIHAIGAGNLLAEVQQSSDITYRVWDYNRRDADGNLRELHTSQAREALDYNALDGQVAPPEPSLIGSTELLTTRYFSLTHYIVDKSLRIEIPQSHSFLAVTCIQGESLIEAEGLPSSAIKQGETVLIPACAHWVVFTGSARLLVTSVPSETMTVNK